MPPQVPPKPRRNSIAGSVDDSGGYDPDDPMRSAYEDSTIGREHSCLPTGLRPARNSDDNNNTNGYEGPSNENTGGRQSVISHRTSTPSRIGPDLVGKDRFDPLSKCFSYVPAKSLKEHYSAPKKAPVRRPSVVEPSNLDIADNDRISATESLRNLNISCSDLSRRAETPKWEAEIDKVLK